MSEYTKTLGFDESLTEEENKMLLRESKMDFRKRCLAYRKNHQEVQDFQNLSDPCHIDETFESLYLR